MSGLEVPALIFGIVSAVAGTTSAIKDVSEKRHESSLYKSEKTIRVRLTSVGIVLKLIWVWLQVGNSVARQTDVVYSSGNGTATIRKNGDMVATSSGSGSSAVAYSKWENAKSWGK